MFNLFTCILLPYTLYIIYLYLGGPLDSVYVIILREGFLTVGGIIIVMFKGMVLYSAVSSPLDRSKRFTLSSPGRPVHSDTVLVFSWKHSSHAAIAQRLFTHMSTTVYSEVLIYTAASTEASWSERKCPNFETVTTGIRTRALSIASPAFYQLFINWFVLYLLKRPSSNKVVYLSACLSVGLYVVATKPPRAWLVPRHCLERQLCHVA